MIFYFSGTGNSHYAAKRIALHNQEAYVSVSSAMNGEQDRFVHSLKENERIGFVFPIHAWAPPKMMLDFIKKLQLDGYRGNYAFAVATCGGNIGNAMKVLGAGLQEKGIALNGCFSVKMPNNYILMGNVDPETMRQKKLAEAEETLKQISESVERRTPGEFRLEKGAFAWLLTGLINPMFTKNAINTANFHVTDGCTGCGTCVKVCNSGSIHLNGKPVWDKACTQCLACVHYCPNQAIQYGKGTVKKGRYTNPNIPLTEIVRKSSVH